MTVKELRELLECYDENAEVRYQHADDGGMCKGDEKITSAIPQCAKDRKTTYILIF